MAKFCSKCGTQLEEGIKFCPKCGQPTEVTVKREEPRQPVMEGMAKEGFKDKFFSFEGRLNRKPFFLRGLALGVVAGILILLVGGTDENASGITLAVTVVIYLICLIGQMALSVRRCHDLNRTGWLALICLVPFLNCILAIYLLFFKGTEGPNRYGEDLLEN